MTSALVAKLSNPRTENPLNVLTRAALSGVAVAALVGSQAACDRPLADPNPTVTAADDCEADDFAEGDWAQDCFGDGGEDRAKPKKTTAKTTVKPTPKIKNTPKR